MEVRIIEIDEESESVVVEEIDGMKRRVDMSGCWRCFVKGCLGDVCLEDDKVFEVEKICVNE